ncbi:diguanylate cyclase (GGDEF)-like protein [Rhodopseudomonas julia]|uniref:Diguanylate cyclase (GGDEF)-like protein n=1 Tax=Rhodopseudomonas julia TaxID=200617 RepID=A0ABU0C7W8_9BRAD|nr:EAL domain-containing protein [Rhodopseudomonas julia]MDQ0326613.1 diguanylate cyclase (GGDEF)-like protein [Rhodopseudomonas julia]
MSVLNNIPCALAVFDLDGRLTITNSAFDRSFPQNCERIRLEASALLASGESRSFEADDGRTYVLERKQLPDGWLVVAQDTSERMAEIARAAKIARTDPITGLGNRLAIREALTTELSSGEQGLGTAAVIAIDLERFKTINESLGQSYGDALLALVAERLRSALGEDDLAARLGGDEFVVLQRKVPQPASAHRLAKRLVDLLARSYLINGHLIDIDVSIGIALLPTDGTSPNDVVKNAHLALRRSRSTGSRSYCFFEPEMDRQMQARRELETDLRRALGLRQFSLVYQPQRDLASGRTSGFEALLRWNHPTRGSVSPAEFIPIAEELRLIVPIGEWVLRTACHEAAGWQEPLTVAVNVSAIQIGMPNFADTLKQALKSSELPAHRLELEITESALIADHPAALETLHLARKMGVRVSMDDFGTGYSSLSYLRSFPFDKIKIDQSFVRADPQDSSCNAIVSAIAALGRSLGMMTLAEGVESQEQWRRIIASGCTAAQGFLVSYPLPPERIGAFLAEEAMRSFNMWTDQSEGNAGLAESE